MKIKKISISGWLGNIEDNLSIDFVPGSNVICGPNLCGKSRLIQDTLSLIKPIESNKIGTPVWNSCITSENITVNLFKDPDPVYVYWSLGNSVTPTYTFHGYDPKEINFNSIVEWTAEEALEVWSLDEIYSNFIDISLLNAKKEEYERFLEGLNFIIDRPTIKSFSSILINNKEKIRAEFNDGTKKFMDEMSFGWKMLVSIILLTPLEKDSIYYLDCPEVGLGTSWCKRLEEGLMRVNPDMQLIIISHSRDIIESAKNRIYLPQHITKKSLINL